MAFRDDPCIPWLALALTPGLGRAARRLIDTYGSAAAALEAVRRGEVDLAARTAADLAGGRTAQRAGGLLARCRQTGVQVLCPDTPSFPPLLSQIADPPLVLFARGDTSLLAAPAVAVVGTRAASTYGMGAAARLAGGLARAGLVVTSGMALGIDGQAHRGCLAAGGSTVAVLGCGIDRPYPAAHRDLYQEISARGCVVSEYPPGTPPARHRFPARNRIISGLSLGVVVVEAGSRSGALITADLALDQGREVFAVPGRVDSPKAAGCHRLLKEGARLVQDVDDILEELTGWWAVPAGPAGDAAGPPEAKKTKKSPVTLDGDGKIVYSCLDDYPKDMDTIIRASGLTAGRVAEQLLLLELQGLVQALPGNLYRKAIIT